MGGEDPFVGTGLPSSMKKPRARKSTGRRVSFAPEGQLETMHLFQVRTHPVLPSCAHRSPDLCLVAPQVDVRRRGSQFVPAHSPAQREAAWPELPGEALQALGPPSSAPNLGSSPPGSDMDLANTTTNLTGMFQAGSLPALLPGSPKPGGLAADFLSRDLIDLQPTPPRGALQLVVQMLPGLQAVA